MYPECRAKEFFVRLNSNTATMFHHALLEDDSDRKLQFCEVILNEF